MSVRYFDPEIALDNDTCVTIGVFDGVHLGHQALLKKTVEEARARGLKSVALTFEPHPLALLKPEAAPKMIYDLQKRCDLIKSTGLDEVIVIRFDQSMAIQSAENFIFSVLVDNLKAKVVVVGEDFRFGNNREGDLGYLKLRGSKLGFKTIGIPLVTDGSKRVSSTLLRSGISAGNMADAYSMMLRYFSYSSRVIHGESRGAELGYPTANLIIDDKLVIPPNGIYAGFCFIDQEFKVAAVSIGIRPTFDDDNKLSFEIFIVDFTGNLYNRTIEIFFVERLRDEIKFESVDALMTQMRVDVEQSVEIIGKLKV